MIKDVAVADVVTPDQALAEAGHQVDCEGAPGCLKLLQHCSVPF